MILSWVFLGYLVIGHCIAKNENVIKGACQESRLLTLSIRTRFTTYLYEITRFSEWKWLCSSIVICAHVCSKMQKKEGVLGGKIGVRPVVLYSQSRLIISTVLKPLSQSLNSKSNTNPLPHGGAGPL